MLAEDLFVKSGFYDDESDREEDGANEQRHGKLLNDIAALDGKKRKKAQRTEPNQEMSEYNLTEVGKEKIRVYELLSALKKNSGTKALQKQIKVASKKKVLPTPLGKPQAEKIKRSLAYDKVSKEVEKWDLVVAMNRTADHLEFPLKQDRVELNTRSFVAGFASKTDLELQVEQLLSNSENVLDDARELTVAEEKALKMMDIDEARERLGELRKMRALLSYQEAKARRTKKIKSKKFHRVLKKERLRIDLKSFEELKQTDPDLAEEKFKVIEKLRIKERMDLKHKSTGKWAKHRQIRAKYDKQSRDDISTQLQLSRQLTEKITMRDEEPEEVAQPITTTSNQDEEIQIDFDAIVNSNAIYNPWMKDTLPKETVALETTPPKPTTMLKPETTRNENQTSKQPIATQQKSTKLVKATCPFKVTQIQEDPDSDDSEEDQLTETLELKNKMEDFDNVEVQESSKPPRKVAPDAPAKAKKPVQIDPEKFVKVQSKKLVSRVPELMETGDDLDDEPQDDLDLRMTIAEAFADDNVIEEFSKEKASIVDANTPKAIDLTLPGWGSWGGTGLKVKQSVRAKFTRPASEGPIRKDHELGHVIINEKANDKLKPHQVSSVPRPFARISQFEQSIKHPVGNTWNPETSFRSLIQPPIKTKSGHAIEPMDADAIILKKKPNSKKKSKIDTEKIDI